MNNILNKIKKAELVGRGGSCFSAYRKWSAMKQAVSSLPAKNRKSYIICNAAEGEPGVKKDGFILEKFGKEVVGGIKEALNLFKSEKAYIYINNGYYKKYGKELQSFIGKAPIELFAKPENAGYIGGEQSAIVNAIEGKKIEPRKKPPFLTSRGLWGYPTLVNNVETFYNISLVSSGKFEQKRFYTIGGACDKPGVYCLSEKLTILEILKQTSNIPPFAFFVQVGGDMSGEVLNSTQLDRVCSGAGSITIYNLGKHDPKGLFLKWMEFFKQESCGQCVPCREGTYRLVEALNCQKTNWKLIAELLNNLDDTAFCGLGCAASVAIKSYLTNVAAKNSVGKIIELKKSQVCECFKN